MTVVSKPRWWSWLWTWSRVLVSTSIPSGTENSTSGFAIPFLPHTVPQSAHPSIHHILFFCRGYKIPVIENLGTTMDQFDCIDFSDNEVRWNRFSDPSSSLLCVPRKLDGFPYLQRVKCLLLNNNRIVRIGESLELNLPRLDTLMLTNNSIQVGTRCVSQST